MPRGFVWAVYIDDEAQPWAKRVDADYVDEFVRGWDVAGVAGLPPLPHLWRARYVIGVDSEGRTQRAIVASELAPLWTGVATTFVVEATDRSLVTCEVVAQMHELRRLGK
jgi:hypothetical protein